MGEVSLGGSWRYGRRAESYTAGLDLLNVPVTLVEARSMSLTTVRAPIMTTMPPTIATAGRTMTAKPIPNLSDRKPMSGNEMASPIK